MTNVPTPPALAVKSPSRRYPGVLALASVSFDVTPDEIHALVGANDVGNSMLILQPPSRRDQGRKVIYGRAT